MKKIFKISAFVLSIAFVLSNCGKMEDVHKEFLTEGNIIYAPRPDTVQSFAGQKRVMLKFYLLNAFNINKCVVEWNEGADTKEIDVTPAFPLDSVEVIIDGLEEKTYLFDVYSIDDKGNRSIKKLITGTSYDEKYISGLTNRPHLGFEGGGTVDSIIVKWGGAAEGCVRVNLSYNDTLGNLVSQVVLPEQDDLVIKNWQSEGNLSYSTSYIPEETAIDTFTLAEETVVMPVNLN